MPSFLPGPAPLGITRTTLLLNSSVQTATVDRTPSTPSTLSTESQPSTQKTCTPPVTPVTSHNRATEKHTSPIHNIQFHPLPCRSIVLDRSTS